MSTKTRKSIYDLAPEETQADENALKVIFNKVIFKSKVSDDNAFAIMGTKSRITVTINMNADHLILNSMQYQLVGEWEDTKYGRQFRAKACTEDKPLSPDSVRRFLTKHVNGITDAKAKEIWNKYGIDAIDVIAKDPRRLVDDEICGEPLAKLAHKKISEMRDKLPIMMAVEKIIAGHGFPKKTAEIVATKWDKQAPQRLKKNPFQMIMAKIPGAGFKRCDRVYLDNGGDPQSIMRLFFASAQALQTDSTGSTWVTRDRAIDLIGKATAGYTAKSNKASRRINEVLEASNVKDITNSKVRKILEYGKRIGFFSELEEELTNGNKLAYIATKRFADAEQFVAKFCTQNEQRENHGDGVSPWGEILEAAKACEHKTPPSEHQWKALANAMRTQVCCLTGGPGTGKTTTVAAIIKAISSRGQGHTVGLMAPTGKAAVRMRESLMKAGLYNFHPTTIHSAYYRHDSGEQTMFPYDFIFVDESSMIDIEVMSMLLSKCESWARVMFVGDPFQLPPVGNGAPFRDLLRSKIVGVGELTDVRRNAGRIVAVCQQIKERGHVVFSDRYDGLKNEEYPENCWMLDRKESSVPIELIKVLNSVKSYDLAKDVQVIVPRNEVSKLSRVELSKMIGEMVNPITKNPVVPGCKFRVGDKVICTQNSKQYSALNDNDPDAKSRWGQGPQVPVANGEIGFVIDHFTTSNSGGYIMALESGQKLYIYNTKATKTADEDEAEATEPEEKSTKKDLIELAWAITVHRSQGSEWPIVIAIVDKMGSQICDANYWYTAISRGKSLTIVLGEKSVFESQIAKRKDDERKTFLSERISGKTDLLKAISYTVDRSIRLLKSRADEADLVRRAKEAERVQAMQDDAGQVDAGVVADQDGLIEGFDYPQEQPDDAPIYEPNEPQDVASEAA